MKFLTAHKTCNQIINNKKISFRAHRDKNHTWATNMDGAIIFNKVQDTTAKAKAWMNSPTL